MIISQRRKNISKILSDEQQMRTRSFAKNWEKPMRLKMKQLLVYYNIIMET